MVSASFSGSSAAAASLTKRSAGAPKILPTPGILCRIALDKVADSVTFSRAEQLRRLLRWLGERSISASLSPSEKEIASTVLGREDFDPQTDSLVRKEMSRLREKLSRYYENEGARDEIIIAADGRYTFSFRRNEKSDALTRRLCCLVLPFHCDLAAADSADLLFEELIFAIGERDRYDLIARTTAMAYRDKNADARQVAAECGADLILEGTLRLREAFLEATVWLVDGKAGRIIRSRRVTKSDPGNITEVVVDWIMESLPDPQE